jgi:hypothetical protein
MAVCPHCHEEACGNPPVSEVANVVEQLLRLRMPCRTLIHWIARHIDIEKRPPEEAHGFALVCEEAAQCGELKTSILAKILGKDPDKICNCDDSKALLRKLLVAWGEKK